MIQGKIYDHNDGTKYIEIPKGWRRISENGSIHYISPTSNYLKSYENIIEYLKKDGTCKCGLDCPFHIHRVFNFDISVLNKEQNDLANNDGHSSTCKLCDGQWLKGKSLVDQRLLQEKPLNQTIKKTTKKPQFSFDGNPNKKVASRSRSRSNDGPKAKRSRNISSPLSDIPSPPPLPNSSPVQNVPNNIGTLNQGPLPSFASIVSSSKFFNPGPNRGPLHPTGSLPLESNNKFAFPKILAPNIPNTLPGSVPTTQIAMPQCMTKKPVVSIPSSSTVTLGSITVTSSFNTTTLPSSMTLVNTSAPTTTVMTNNKSVAMPIINTPTLPSVFAPLDGVGETVKKKPPSKPRPRPRASRAKPKPKAEPKLDNKKMPKGAVNAGAVMTGLMPNLTGTAALPSMSQWSPMNTVGHMQFQTPSNAVSVSSSFSNATSVTTTLVQGIIPTSRLASTPHSLPQPISLPSSIAMSTSYQNHSVSQAMQVSSPTVSNFQVPPALKSPTTTMANGGRDNVSSFSSVTPSSVSMSSAYSVVATPRIQAPPGMMYVAAAPGLGMFPSYPYAAAAAAAAQQLQMTQASTSQPQNKTSSATTTVSTSQQPAAQGVSSESGPGKVNVQIPGMYVQSAAGSQMFPVNAQGFGGNQYKTPYQFQNAVYPNAMPGSAMAFIAPNGAKTTYPGIPAMAGQFTYPNPYMFGIFMPSTTNQQSTTSTTSTRSSPSTPTSVTTTIPMIQQQSLQNAAVAAAFESFVPIAPAAGGAAANSSPRFAQTLAHLASAYNTFPQGGLLPGANANQLHLAYQMMQMNPHVNLQQVANIGGATANDNPKHPTPSAAKGGSSTDSSKTSSNTQTPSANSPGTPASQDHGGGMRSPFTFPHTTASTSLTSSQSLSTTAVTTQSQQTAKTHHNQNTSDLRITEAPDQHGLGNYSETVKHQYESDNTWQSEPGKGGGSQDKKPISTNGPPVTDQSDSINTEHCKISPLANQRNMSELDYTNQSSHPGNQHQNYQRVSNDNLSPVRTHNTPFEQNINTNKKPGHANSHSLNKDIPNQIHLKGSALTHNPKQLTRTLKGSDRVQSPSYADTVKNYYETNPLLGMKRSCEAIEVYLEPKERLDDDKDEYYSPTDESNDGGTPVEESTSDCAIDHRHGVDNTVEEPIRIAEQNTTEVHNGGCDPAHSEQDNTESDADNYVPNFFADAMPVPQPKRHFNIGDIVWAQARGLPSWPGQIVDENRVGKGQPDDGKKWVMWFGDHTFSQVEEDRLKTLNEGLRALDDKSRKKKYRAKKARISLEQAITEALEELQMREQVKERQEMAPKSKKKRLR